MKSSKCDSLIGKIKVPGDKSISHRSLIIASQAVGESKITGLLEGDDVINTAKALQQLGVGIEKKDDMWLVNGVGVGGLKEPRNIIDMGNSGTGVRLLMGLVAPYDFNVSFTGDESLCSRPMARVLRPLTKMGVSYESAASDRLPILIKQVQAIMPVDYTLDVPSAQVKSAIILAALNCPGITKITESRATRDHTELMLKSFGADINIAETENAGRRITISGYPDLSAQDAIVPGDPSSCAFLVVAALIVPGSKLTIENICINPMRIGVFTTLKEMGGKISFENEREIAGEKVADIKVEHSDLHGVVVPEDRAPSMIDEYPILAIAAAVANGETVMEGLAELKVKESNRLDAIFEGLQRVGVKSEKGEESLKIYGGDVPGGCNITTHMDHRICMSFMILGMISKDPILIDDGSMINTSFPDFLNLVNNCGGRIEAL